MTQVINSDFDVIILGANYAGLATAGELRAGPSPSGGRRVLLLDHRPIGSHQASTCALWTSNVEALGANHAILQTLHAWHIHIGDRTYAFPTPDYPICVLDHATLCKHLYARSDAQFRQEVVCKVRGNEVVTDRGSYRAPVVIEALGWQGFRKREGKRRNCNLALETELPVGAQELPLDGNSLHVYFAPWRWGIGGGWVFPSGATTRVGFGRYDGAGKLDGVVSDLLGDYSQSLAPRRYGNYLPWRLRAPVVDGRYVVGDAAGQCLGLIGEGIRSAIYFGIAAARCANEVLDGQLTADEGLRRYRRFVAAHRVYFELFSALQVILPRLPASLLRAITGWLESSGLGTQVLYWYARIFDVPALMASPSLDRRTSTSTQAHGFEASTGS